MKSYYQAIIILLTITSTIINASKKKSKGKHILNGKSATIHKEQIIAASDQLKNSMNETSTSQGPIENENIKYQTKVKEQDESNENSLNEVSSVWKKDKDGNIKREISSVWNKDEDGNIKQEISSEWNKDEDGNIKREISSVWNKDEDGNMKREISSVWNKDEDGNNKQEISSVWNKDKDGNIKQKITSVWINDENGYIKPETSSVWNKDENGNIKQQQISSKEINASNKNSIKKTSSQYHVEHTNAKKGMKIANANESKNNSSNQTSTSQNQAKNISIKPQTKIIESDKSHKILINQTPLTQGNNTGQRLRRSKSNILQHLIKNGYVKMSIDIEELKTMKALDSLKYTNKGSTSRSKHDQNKQKHLDEITTTKNFISNDSGNNMKLKATKKSKHLIQLSKLYPETFENNQVKGWKEKAQKYSKVIEDAEQQIISSYETQVVEKICQDENSGNPAIYNRDALVHVSSGSPGVAYAKARAFMLSNPEDQETLSPYEKYVTSEEVIGNDIIYVMGALEDYIYKDFFKHPLEDRDEIIGWRMNIVSAAYFDFKKEIANESAKEKKIREHREHVCKKRNGKYTTANEICVALRTLYFWQGNEQVTCVQAIVDNNANWDSEWVALCKMKWPKKGSVRLINDPFTGMILDAAKNGPDITLGILDGEFPHGFWLAAVLTENEPHRVKIINQLEYVKDGTVDLIFPTALNRALETTIKCTEFELYKPDELSSTDAAHKVMEWVIMDKPGEMWDRKTGVFSDFFRKKEKQLKKKEKLIKLLPKEYNISN